MKIKGLIHIVFRSFFFFLIQSFICVQVGDKWRSGQLLGAPPTIQAPGIELRSSGLMASVLPNRQPSQPHCLRYQLQYGISFGGLDKSGLSCFHCLSGVGRVGWSSTELVWFHRLYMSSWDPTQISLVQQETLPGPFHCLSEHHI